jgi:hypothetical protein
MSGSRQRSHDANVCEAELIDQYRPKSEAEKLVFIHDERTGSAVALHGGSCSGPMSQVGSGPDSI